jgi:hypothetical protein
MKEDEAVNVFNQYLIDKFTFLQTNEYRKCVYNKICETENLANCRCFSDFREEMLALKEQALLEQEIINEQIEVL